MKRHEWQALWTLPNVVSMSRVLLAAGFFVSTETGARALLVGAASASDFLDGWLARRRNAVTQLGALIDPIADRIFVLVAVVAFLVGGQLTLAECAVLLSRDIMTTIGFVVARIVSWLRPIPFTARVLGKVVTAAQLGTLLVVLLWPGVAGWCIAAVGVLSLLSVVDYTWALWRASERTRR
jgi:phosphatidylglycerophosphate synthase